MTMLALVIVLPSSPALVFSAPLQSYKISKKPSRNKVKAKSRARDFLRIYQKILHKNNLNLQLRYLQHKQLPLENEIESNFLPHKVFE